MRNRAIALALGVAGATWWSGCEESSPNPGDAPTAGSGGATADGGGSGGGTGGAAGSSGSASDASSDVPSQDSGDACQKLSVDKLKPGAASSQAAQLIGKFSPQMGTGIADTFALEFYPQPDPQQPGTYDLSKEADYGTCQHCVVVFVDGVDAGTAKKIFFQESGTMEVTSIKNPPTLESSGKLSQVKLVEVTVDTSHQFHSTKKPGGECLVLDALSWDTVVVANQPCDEAVDCVDMLTKVCDPATRTCVDAQCGLHAKGDCTSDQLCIYQEAGTMIGACFPSCTPLTGTCAANAECVIASHDGQAGVCKERGTGAADSQCKSDDISTKCVAGSVCSYDDAFGNTQYCRAQCDFWQDTVPCSVSGQRCIPPGTCSAAPAPSIALGALCGSSKVGTACGDDGAAYRGVCAGDPKDPGNATKNYCAKWCRMQASPSDCAAGELCYATTAPSIGYCGLQ
ncbi:MAG: hypothetical protein HY898_04205 [Deltaproteobacteria bacterium]|nr:hypothetical protein [Deltaproteobacteria bacterium]